MEKKSAKPVVVRQTKASLYRMAKVNPIQFEDKEVQLGNQKIIVPSSVLHSRRYTLEKMECDKFVKSLIQKKEAEAARKKSDIQLQGSKLPAQKNVGKKENEIKKPLAKQYNLKPPKPNVKKAGPSEGDGIFKMPLMKAPRVNTAAPLRRSLSAEHFTKRQNATPNNHKDLSRTSSSQGLNTSGLSNTELSSSFTTHRSRFISSTPAVKNLKQSAYSKLRQPLQEWLSKRGKTIENYHHLKCFGLQQLTEEEREEEKENIEMGVRSESYEALNIPQPSNEKQEFLKNIVTGALEDMNNLIVIGYPVLQCEEWLQLIHKKHENVVKLPEYWECRAAIEQGRGNFSSAIECYKNSIINGADVEHIDESLNQLLTKFSMLNIDTKTVNEEKNRRENEAVRNIFKSTIIQFAIQERSNSKSTRNQGDAEATGKRFVATPVRRSTRKSCGKFQHTPGKTMCNSLKDLDSSIRESLDFENNSYLMK